MQFEKSLLSGLVLLCIGAFIACFNFHLSFTRPWFYRLRRGGLEGYNHSSGAPLIGSFAFVGAAILLRDSTIWMVTALVVALFDTGGVHWMIGSILWHERMKPRTSKPTSS